MGFSRGRHARQAAIRGPRSVCAPPLPRVRSGSTSPSDPLLVNLRRSLFAFTVCIAALFARASANDAAIIINEIHYHPVVGDTEWIELHSLSGVDIDISGWRLADGVDYTFAEGAKMPGHGWIVVAATPGAASLAGIGALGPWTGVLNNAGEKITLLNRTGREMDSVTYSDGGDWPAGADGSGATLARRNSESANPDASSWTASADTGGTPGRANFAVSGQGPTVATPSDLNSMWKYFVAAEPPGATFAVCALAMESSGQ